MILGSPPFTLDWLTLGNPDEPDANGVEWHLTKVTGFFDGGVPRSDNNIYEQFNAHGAMIGPVYMKERTIVLEGRAFAPDFTTLRQAQLDVIGLCSGDPAATFPLTCHSEIAEITCDVKLDDHTTTTPTKVFTPCFDYSIQLVAPDPRKYSLHSYSKQVGLPRVTVTDGLDFLATTAGDTGLDFGSGAAGTGLNFGSQSAEFAFCYNQGSAPAPAVITIYGPLINPLLTSNLGNYRMIYNGTLDVGDFVVIDPIRRTVLLNGTDSRRWLLNPCDFAGFTVPPRRANTAGLLKVGLTHDGATDAAGYVTVDYRDTWL